jgi:hypothetical protein
MVLAPCARTAPVPPPAYHRAQAKVGPPLHVDALTLVSALHLLALCRLAGRLARRRCPPPLPAGPGGRPRRYREESLLLLALLRTLWRLSYQDLHDWLVAWPALALACGLPADTDGRSCVPSAAQQCRRGTKAGAPPCESLLVVLVRLACIHHVRLLMSGLPSTPGVTAWRGSARGEERSSALRRIRDNSLLFRALRQKMGQEIHRWHAIWPWRNRP